MSKTIRIDDDVFEALKKKGQPFIDTPNSILQKILKLKYRQPHKNMKIEKGIPIPVGIETGRGKAINYAYLENMEIGDSIVMTHKQRNTLYNYISRSSRRRYDYKFISKATKNKKTRVWLKEKKSRDQGD